MRVELARFSDSGLGECVELLGVLMSGLGAVSDTRMLGEEHALAMDLAYSRARGVLSDAMRQVVAELRRREAVQDPTAPPVIA